MRPQGDGLAARVGPGDDERRVAVAEPDVDRDDPTGQAGMTRAEEDDLRPRRRLGPDSVELGGELGLGAPEVEAGERAERLPQGRRVRPDDGRQLVEDPLDLGLLRDLRLAPGVAELDGHERLDEQRLAAARRVVDDALDPASGVGLDRHDVASVAEGDDGLLERTAELRADERVEAPLQAVVGDPDRRPEPAEARARRCRAARRPGRSCGRACSAGPAGHGAHGRGRAGAGGARRRGPSRGATTRRGYRRSRGSGPDRGGRRGRPARSTARCRGRRRCRQPDRSARRERAWSVSSRPRVTMTGSFDGSRASASRRPGPKAVVAASRSRTSGELEQGDRSGVHRGQPGSRTIACAGPMPPGCRPGRTAAGRRSTARRRSRCRSAASPRRSRAARQPGRRRPGTAASGGRTGRRRSDPLRPRRRHRRGRARPRAGVLRTRAMRARAAASPPDRRRRPGRAAAERGRGEAGRPGSRPRPRAARRPG